MSTGELATAMGACEGVSQCVDLWLDDLVSLPNECEDVGVKVKYSMLYIFWT